QIRLNDTFDKVESGSGGEFCEHRDSLAERMIDQQRAVECEQIKHKELHRLFGPEFLDVARAPKPAHHLLERDRTPARIYRDHLAVEDRTALAKTARNLNDLGQAWGDLVHAAGENSHLAGTEMMDLHTRAVDLVLEGDFRTEHRECLRDIGGGLRKHRLHRLDDPGVRRRYVYRS